ncbi:hypothetical protein FocTR4_00014012, partial [Fusarium oxysporum f. sp. cubense]
SPYSRLQIQTRVVPNYPTIFSRSSLPSLANAAANRAPSRGLESTGLVFTLRAFVVNFGDIFFSSWTILSVTSCVATQNTMSALVLD